MTYKTIRTSALACTTMLAISACASHPNEIPAQYISPMQYRSHSCEQIGLEMERVSRRTSERQGSIAKKAGADSVQMGVGLILFWPTLFFLDGDGPEAAEYARLKGEFEALEQSAIEKKCDIHIRRAPEKPANPKPEPQRSGARS